MFKHRTSQWVDNYFDLGKNQTSVRTEIIAGITTFMTMAYILAVNPSILAMAGMDKSAVFTATVLSSFLATIIMALVAKLPFALAPGMGYNAYFAFTVVLVMGYTWQFALTAVLIEGIIFIILTLSNIREKIIDSIPMSVKHAISAGIGLFVAFIGLQNAGVIVKNDAVLVGLGNIGSASVLVTLGGVILMSVLLIYKVRGALLLGILFLTLIGIPLGLTQMHDSMLVSLPPSIEPVFCKFEIKNLFTGDMLLVVFILLFTDIFNTLGTLVGVASKAGMLDKNGNVPRVKQAFLADAIGTAAGAILGTSTVTTYVESAAGVAEGGKTGLTSLTTSILFLIALFFAPVFTMVPAAATAPALIVVGFFMMSPILSINFDDFSEAVPAFLTIIIMPLAFSIADGIAFGLLSYVLIKALSRKFSDISISMLIVAIFMIIRYIFN